MEIIFFLVGLWIVISIVSYISETISNARKYVELKPEVDNLRSAKQEHEIKIKRDNEEISKRREDILKIAKQKSMGFPWLAEAYADYLALKDELIADYLINKKNPAYKAAENVRIIKNEKKELVRENKIIRYKISYYESMFPWLVDLIAEDENEELPVSIIEDENDKFNEDRVKNFLTPEEYRNLPSVERNQLALNRYINNRNKSKWAIGRDYEMYVGHLYQENGYQIEYKGIIDGFDDLGRDIIASKGSEVCIIQCKRWSQYKEIHEKHIFQLFGTTMEYWLKNFNKRDDTRSFKNFSKFLSEKRLRPIFFTTTKLSERARDMALALGIELRECEQPGEFPRIKCNINNDEFGSNTKIYHLPMDQQYDRTIIGNKNGEFFAYTVEEAEKAGFRRAFKHRYSS